MTPLAQLHADIDVRVQTIRENRADWLCGKGCDNCCRQLANVPQLTAAEWDLLQVGLAALAPERLQEIRSNMAALSGQQSPPITCPLLDLATGSCPVYAQRPVACRTYGFYVQRALGLYCHDIEARVWDPRTDFPNSKGEPVAADIPCNICSMPKIRNNKLEWLQVMRSNPRDCFWHFTVQASVRCTWTSCQTPTVLFPLTRLRLAFLPFFFLN